MLEGVTRTSGVPGSAAIMNANPSLKRAIILWGAAVAVLFVFHVGGARLG